MEAGSCKHCSKDLSKLNVINSNRRIEACARKIKSTAQFKSITSFFPKKTKICVSINCSCGLNASGVNPEPQTFIRNQQVLLCRKMMQKWVKQVKKYFFISRGRQSINMNIFFDLKKAVAWLSTTEQTVIQDLHLYSGTHFFQCCDRLKQVYFYFIFEQIDFLTMMTFAT